jgi:hypothetical protein
VAECVFCGATGKLSGEHVLGDWLTRTPLNQGPVPQAAGPLNRLGRDLGTSPPFRRKVNDVCKACNSGWMSRLERAASRVMTPFILGQHGRIEVADQPAIAAWAQKAVLVAMRVSSDAERQQGYGLPSVRYRELYTLRDEVRPLPASQFWIGRYQGVRKMSVRATPVVVTPRGARQSSVPQGYVMTVTIGHLVVHGIQFTEPALEVPMATQTGLAQIWQVERPAEWPTGMPITDDAFHRFTRGETLICGEPSIQVDHWRPATELTPSRPVGSTIELPTICGKHVEYYQASLAVDARRSRFYAFVTSCECGTVYLIHTEPDGAHCKAAGTVETILAIYESLPGEECEIQDGHGLFVCKKLVLG